MADTEKLRSGWKHYVEKTKKEPGFYGTEYIIEGREPGDFQMLPLSEHQIFDLGGRSPVSYTHLFLICRNFFHNVSFQNKVV